MGIVVIIKFAGGIDVDEMVEIVGNLYELEGLSKVIQSCLPASLTVHFTSWKLSYAMLYWRLWLFSDILLWIYRIQNMTLITPHKEAKSFPNQMEKL